MPDEPKLGKVISCRNHVDYFVSIYREGEISPGPRIADFPIGRFVRIGDGDHAIVGIVISSQVLSDEGLGVGQHRHAMPSEELNVFTPEIMHGAVKIIEARGIGAFGPDGQVKMGMPQFSPSYQDPVSGISDGDIASMHTQDGKLHLEYIRELMMRGDAETYSAVVNALKHLMEILPEHRQMIDLIRQEMIWNGRQNI